MTSNPTPSDVTQPASEELEKEDYEQRHLLAHGQSSTAP